MAITNGSNGSDVLTGTSQTGDIINGFQGDDLIEAGPGNDIINAGDGANVLVAGPGTDLIFAGSGPNSFFAASGNAVFSAGSASNQFYFAPQSTSTPEGGGKVWIVGFHNGDVINLDAFPDIQSFEQLHQHMAVSGANSVIDVSSEIGRPPGSQVITVLNNNHMQAQDFVFRPSESFGTGSSAATPATWLAAGEAPLGQMIALANESHAPPSPDGAYLL